MAKSKCTEGVGLILISYDGIKHHKYDQYDEIGFWYSSSVTSSNMIHLMFFSDNMQLPNHVSYGKTLNDIKDNPMINKVKLLKYSNAKDEDNLRTFVCHIFSTNERNPDVILHNLMEKIVLTSPCSNKDYLDMSQFFSDGNNEDVGLSEIELKIKNMKDNLQISDSTPKNINDILANLEKCAFEEIKV